MHMNMTQTLRTVCNQLCEQRWAMFTWLNLSAFTLCRPIAYACRARGLAESCDYSVVYRRGTLQLVGFLDRSWLHLFEWLFCRLVESGNRIFSPVDILRLFLQNILLWWASVFRLCVYLWEDTNSLSASTSPRQLNTIVTSAWRNFMLV